MRPTLPVRVRRLAFAAAVGSLALLTAVSPVLAAVTWSTPVQSSTDAAYGNSAALARTASSTTTYLHSLFTRTVIGGVPVADAGPKLGVYYRRGNSTGSSWSPSVRLNSTSTHADQGVVAVSGKYVYTAWVETAHIDSAFKVSDPRPIKFRRNTSHGSSTAWQPRLTLSLPATLADRPMIAASGQYVTVTWTDAQSGNISVVTSYDYGASFTDPYSIGTTDALVDGIYYRGTPVVAQTAGNIVVVWATQAGSKWASADAGGIWTMSGTFSATGDQLSAAGRGTRIAVAWVDDAGVWYEEWLGVGWAPARKALGFAPTSTYKLGFTPAIAIQGTGGVGVAVAACTAADCHANSTAGVNVVWRESTNQGQSWTSKTLASYTASSTRRVNDTPSVLWSTSTKRFFTWTASSASGATYRVLFRSGIGTP